jgi:CheY-like chemotaxis protein
MKSQKEITPLNVLLSDDDRDDRYFFDKALKELPMPTTLETVEDGEKLMAYLYKNSDHLPDVLFLDLNMARKNGTECLTEIKADLKLRSLPVVIYSTSLNDDIADKLYDLGAHYYLEKRDLSELIDILESVFTMLTESNFKRTDRKSFIPSQHALKIKN